MRILLTIILILSMQITYGQDSKILHAGTLMNIPGKKSLKKQSVLVRNGKIISVRSGFLSPSEMNAPDAQVINLSDKYLMPGFIDMHVHVTGERDPQANRHEWTTLNRVDEGLNAIPYLKNTLMAGFTTVRDLGADYQVIIPLKRAVANGTIEGPRIIAATGVVSATGGHGDFHGYRTEIMEAIEKNVGVCDGADDCRRAVRALVKQGADVIKITATGGVLSNTNAGVGQQLTDEELEAIVATARALGRKVAAHAHAADGVNAALRAGVNSIEHGSFLDETSVKLFRENDAYLVPTLLAGIWMSEEMSQNDQIPPAIVQKINFVLPAVERSFRLAVENNVKIAFGTDSGVSKHGANAREFELMVRYGMSPEAAIASATVVASELLGMSDQLGTIEANKWADIIATDKDPAKDITALKDITFVMKAGVVYD